jgi:hypothetical protein
MLLDLWLPQRSKIMNSFRTRLYIDGFKYYPYRATHGYLFSLRYNLVK